MKRVIVCSIILAASPVPVGAASPVIQVGTNYFDPKEVFVEPGEDVTWIARASGHSIRSDAEIDGVPLFEFPAGSGELAVGETARWVPSGPGVYTYHCEIHGTRFGYPANMTGKICVGCSSGSGEEVRAVPRDYPTIASALADAPARTTIELAPGIYRESVVVETEDVVIRGAGKPHEVVLTGNGIAAVGIDVRAPGATVQNLTVTDFVSVGVQARGVRDVVIDRVHVVDAITGIRVIDASGVAILRNVVTGNSTGIRLAGPSSLRGAHVFGNVVSASTRVALTIAGAQHASIEQNRIESASGDGISVSSGPGPSIQVRVAHNVIEVQGAALAWDLLGAEVCFTGNVGAAGDGVTSSPPHLQLVFGCRAGPT